MLPKTSGATPGHLRRIPSGRPKRSSDGPKGNLFIRRDTPRQGSRRAASATVFRTEMTTVQGKNRYRRFFSRRVRLLSDFLQRRIWQSSALREQGLRGRVYALLRILAIILNGLSNNRLLSRSAALSYYSLIGLGPVIAIAFMVSGFILEKNATNVAEISLNRALQFIAPPVAQLTRISQTDSAAVAPHGGDREVSPLSPGTHPRAKLQGSEEMLNEDLVNLIGNIIRSAQSGTVGVIGGLLLVVIGIQLLTSIETTFNEIWGVRRGRSWAHRVVFYWTFITLGSLLGIAAITLFSTATIVRWFKLLPFGAEITRVYLYTGPLFSFLLMVALLYGFYRMIPNTRVNWQPALVGAAVVAVLLILNNFLSVVYVQRVISQGSLYGSVGIIPVLMIGLYVFWFFVLIGGQITYSVQNAATLSHQEAWENVSENTRVALSLAAFLVICRRFKHCLPACSVDELARRLRAPEHILNESLNRLVDLGFINGTIHQENHRGTVKRYQPARPLDKFTLGGFREALEHYGNDEGAEIIDESDAAVAYFRREMRKLKSTPFGTKTIDQLLTEEE